jgi:hypothetical protein
MSFEAAEAVADLSDVPGTDTEPKLRQRAQRPANVFFNAFICFFPFCFYSRIAFSCLFCDFILPFPQRSVNGFQAL